MALAIVVALGIALGLYITGVFVILTPLPLAVLYLKKGPLAALVSFLTALVALLLLYRISAQPLSFLPMAFFYPHFPLFQVMALAGLYFFYYGLMGLVTAYFATQKITMEKSMLGILGVGTVAPALLLFLLCRLTGLQPMTELGEALHSMIHQMIELQQKSGVDTEEVMVLQKYGDVLVRQAIRILPAFWITGTLVVASLNILFLRRWAVVEKPFTGWVPYPLWRLKEGMIWGPILAGAVYFLNYYLGHLPVLNVIILNILIVLGGIYFLHGLAIISYFFQKRLSPLTRIFAYGLLFLFIQLAAVAIIVLGLFDFWFDFRKLKRVA